MPDGLTPARAAELEELFAPDSTLPVTAQDAEDWQTLLATKPEPRYHVDEDGLRQMDADSEADLDAWLDRPMSLSLQRLSRAPARVVRIHAPARFEARPRGRRRSVRRRAGAPSRLSDDPEPPLAVVSPEAFRRDVDRWLGAA